MGIETQQIVFKLGRVMIQKKIKASGESFFSNISKCKTHLMNNYLYETVA